MELYCYEVLSYAARVRTTHARSAQGKQTAANLTSFLTCVCLLSWIFRNTLPTLPTVKMPFWTPFRRPWTSRVIVKSGQNPQLLALVAKLRTYFGTQFFKRSLFCHCFLKQSACGLHEKISSKTIERYLSSFSNQERWSRYATRHWNLALLPMLLAAMNQDDLITDELMDSHKSDLNHVDSLIQTTLTCKSCSKRHLIDQKVEGVEYCQCKDRKASVYGTKVNENENWMPFLERKNILVWRQEHPELKGLYAYKMYGKFEDISADEFLAVQTDLSDFRLSWDPSTAQCHVIDSKVDNEWRNVSQVYYWEVNWPRFFSNRDYVCGRRSKVFKDPEGNEDAIVLFTKSTEHSNCPKKSKCFRVENYWSVISMRPLTTCDQEGIEFVMTGFENPGLSLPSSITTWVAVQAMPDYIQNLRKACIERRQWLKKSPKSPNLSTAANEPSYLETPRQYNDQSANYA